MSDTNNPGPQSYPEPTEPVQGAQPPSTPPAPAAQPGPPPYSQAPPPYTQPYTQPGMAPMAAPMAPASERTWAAAAHWSALVAGLIGAGIFCFAGPLIVMLTKGTVSPVVRRHAVESLNFQISMLIYALVSVVLMFVLVGFLTILVVGVMWLVFPIIASLKASNGEDYRYPLTIRLVN